MVAPSYARLYRANSVLTASPGQLVVMLFDGALAAIAAAKDGFNLPPADLRRYEVINKQIQKAQRIVRELRGSLNFEVGGDFAPMMYRLYEYYDRRLFEGNLKKQVEPLIEVEQLMRQLRDAWAQMVQKPDAAPAALAVG